MPKYQATSYIRLSYTDDRSSESDSVTNQRKLIENFIERNPDIEIISEKIDDGYSGIIFDRPAFKEMMQDITDGKINCVIVKDLSRLGREYIETGRYLRRVFPTYGVRFIAITDNIDTAHESSGDDLTVSVKNIMNEAYCRDISIKTRTSLDIKRRNGDFVGAFPVYGYMKSEENKNLLVPDPYASRVVQDIFRMRLDGMSAMRIATVLNEMGILSPLAYKKNNGFPYAKHGYADKEDCKWSATTIIRILQDETYIGTLVQGKQGTPHYKIKQMEQRPSSEWIRVPDAHEPLIAKQDFELVQRIRRLDTRTSPKQDNLVDFPLAEIREQFCFDDILLGLPCAFFQPRLEIVGVDFAERLKAHIQITGALLLKLLLPFQGFPPRGESALAFGLAFSCPVRVLRHHIPRTVFLVLISWHLRPSFLFRRTVH